MRTKVKRAADALHQTEDTHWNFEKFYNDPQNVTVTTKIKETVQAVIHPCDQGLLKKNLCASEGSCE